MSINPSNRSLQPNLVEVGEALDELAGMSGCETRAYALGYLTVVVRGLADEHDGCPEHLCSTCIWLRSALALLAALDLYLGNLRGLVGDAG